MPKSSVSGYQLIERTGTSLSSGNYFIAESLDDNHRVTVYTDNLRKPRKHSPEEFLKAGMILDLYSSDVTLTCGICGATVSPCICAGGRLGKGVWRCINGCNANL